MAKKKKKSAASKRAKGKARAYQAADIYLPANIYNVFNNLPPQVQKDILLSIFDVHQAGDHVFQIDKVNIKSLGLNAAPPRKVCNGP